MTTRLETLVNPFKSVLRLPRGWDIRFSPRFLAYTPTYDFSIETKNYRLETASSLDDLLEVFELRHKVFFDETGVHKEGADGFDLDEYDSVCDHIVIRSKDDDKIVGTYRVISSVYSDVFYSQSEFNLDDFLNTEDQKLELGRACIDRSHRNGAVIDLLWKGIAHYLSLTGAKYLFGCSSIKLTDPAQSKGLMSYLQSEGHLGQRFDISPIGEFNRELSKVEPVKMSPLEGKGLIPPLLRSYFNAGSKVYGEPAFDQEFKCIDFLTVLDISEISPSYKRRYFK